MRSWRQLSPSRHRKQCQGLAGRTKYSDPVGPVHPERLHGLRLQPASGLSPLHAPGLHPEQLRVGTHGHQSHLIRLAGALLQSVLLRVVSQSDYVPVCRSHNNSTHREPLNQTQSDSDHCLCGIFVHRSVGVLPDTRAGRQLVVPLDSVVVYQHSG